MPWVMNMEVKNIVVDVVDNDRSTLSQQLVHEIEANKYFIFHGQQAIFVMWFFMVILLLLSGLFTPTRSMPPFAYLSTYINPVSYFIEAMRTVFIRGGNISSIAHQLLALSGIGLFMGTWAVVSYKKNKR